MKYNVLIVDDEFLARKLLASYIEKLPNLNLVATCGNAFEAFSKIKEQEIDIMLLDINMPDLNGLEFAKTCTNVPAIIFTTAYSEYAVESYEINAVDYLLKPIAMNRFMVAIEKAVDRLKNERETKSSPDNNEKLQDDQQLDNIEEISMGHNKDKSFIMVKADYKLYKINFDDLIMIEGQHEYVSFYTTGKRITALYSLKSLEEILPKNQFVRVHKSYIVSINKIQEIEQVVINVAGKKLPIGATYRETLNQALGIKQTATNKCRNSVEENE